MERVLLYGIYVSKVCLHFASGVDATDAIITYITSIFNVAYRIPPVFIYGERGNLDNMQKFNSFVTGSDDQNKGVFFTIPTM